MLCCDGVMEEFTIGERNHCCLYDGNFPDFPEYEVEEIPTILQAVSPQQGDVEVEAVRYWDGHSGLNLVGVGECWTAFGHTALLQFFRANIEHSASENFDHR